MDQEQGKWKCIAVESHLLLHLNVRNANNVKKYRWQYKNSVGQWTNTTLNGYNTNSVRVVVTAARYGMLFRCVVTGLDNNDIYSDEVTIINPNE